MSAELPQGLPPPPPVPKGFDRWHNHGLGYCSDGRTGRFICIHREETTGRWWPFTTAEGMPNLIYLEALRAEPVQATPPAEPAPPSRLLDLNRQPGVPLDQWQDQEAAERERIRRGEQPPRQEGETPDIAAAIATIESSRKTHVDWGAYFEAHPEQEAKYAETVDGAEKQREIVAAYDNVLACLQRTEAAERRAAGAEEENVKLRDMLTTIGQIAVDEAFDASEATPTFLLRLVTSVRIRVEAQELRITAAESAVEGLRKAVEGMHGALRAIARQHDSPCEPVALVRVICEMAHEGLAHVYALTPWNFAPAKDDAKPLVVVEKPHPDTLRLDWLEGRPVQMETFTRAALDAAMSAPSAKGETL